MWLEYDCRRFDPGGSLDRRVNLSMRVLAQMGWRKTEHKGKARLVLSRTRGCARSRGYKRSRERERESLFVSSFSRVTFRMKALDLFFIDARRGSRCTMGGVARR